VVFWRDCQFSAAWEQTVPGEIWYVSCVMGLLLHAMLDRYQRWWTMGRVWHAASFAASRHCLQFLVACCYMFTDLTCRIYIADRLRDRLHLCHVDTVEVKIKLLLLYCRHTKAKMSQWLHSCATGRLCTWPIVVGLRMMTLAASVTLLTF